MKANQMSRIVATLVVLVLLFASNQASTEEVSASSVPPISSSRTSLQNQEIRIVYSVPSDRGIAYYTMNADGSNKQAVATDFFDNNRWIPAIGASYSPDGGTLAFGAVDREGDYRTGDLDSDTLIHILDLNNYTVARLDTVGNSYKPLWSPDGSAIAFLANGQALHIIDMATGIEHPVLDSGVLLGIVGMRGFVSNFDWSPDGSLLAADVTLIGGPEGGGYTTIFVMNSTGTDVHQVLAADTYASSPAWGPQGDMLYYVCISNSEAISRVEICAVNLTTSQITQITHFEGAPVGGISEIDVSNEEQIVFVSHPSEGTPDIYRYDIGTGNLVNLTTDVSGWVSSPRWIEPQPVPPTASAGLDQTPTDTDASGSELVTLDGSGSSDPDGTIVGYSWTENEVEIATGVTPTIELAVGVHTLTLTVTDDDGLTASDEVVITVEAAPEDPRVTNGLQVLYTFAEGEGAVVHDVSGVGTPVGHSSRS